MAFAARKLATGGYSIEPIRADFVSETVEGVAAYVAGRLKADEEDEFFAAVGQERPKAEPPVVTEEVSP